MSRTDKTDPEWVGAWWEARHYYRCPEAARQGLLFIGPAEPCDLPDDPPHGPPIRATWHTYNRHGSRCNWRPDLPSYYSKRGRRFFGRGRHVGFAANRFERGVRAAWRDCAKKLVATPIGEIDELPLPDPRHRHFAIWDW